MNSNTGSVENKNSLKAVVMPCVVILAWLSVLVPFNHSLAQTSRPEFSEEQPQEEVTPPVNPPASTQPDPEANTRPVSSEPQSQPGSGETVPPTPAQTVPSAARTTDTSETSAQGETETASRNTQTPPTPDSPSGFISCEGKSCSACDFVVLGNTAIKWLITISFLFFAVLAVRAGIKLVTSQGNPSALSNAKESFTNAFIGLIIILLAFLLVDTIMRQLVKGSGEIKGYGPWNEVVCAKQVESLAPDADNPYYPGDPTFEAPPLPAGVSVTKSAGCTGGSCVAITIPCVAKGCTISSDMVSRLESMHQKAGVPGARVTEAMPPSRTHKSQCHSNGTCIDYSKAGGMSGAEVKRVIDAAYASGLRPVYEVKTEAQKNQLVVAGVPSESVKVLGNWISAPHFSIYGY